MHTFRKKYDVIVVGGGHSGIEAALAASRTGSKVAIISQNLDTIGQMSCNPAIGGLGKGQIVREIDALGGIMGINTDATGIQFRTLNLSKGPSVRAIRAQCDKKAYQFRIRYILEKDANIDLHQGSVSKLKIINDKAVGVKLNFDITIESRSVVITTGTFMRGLIHLGLSNQKGGRMGDADSSLSQNLKELNFEIDRFKTGTPCRLNGRSIDFSKCERQDGDTPPPQFSFSDFLDKGRDDIFTLNSKKSGLFHVEQLPCWITYTNHKTHKSIRDNINKSAMYSGNIESVGPRYCPSIEDKVVRFEDKERHQVFLEPEGKHTLEYYVNGVSTSLPYDVQCEFIQSISGLENAEIIRPGYAVEYDYCVPTQLFPTLETKKIENLYFAGQINGTSGYEEAAAQGLIAGANASLKVQGKKELIIKRNEAYIGVLIDDLINKGVDEPYRMFTSRAEYRLLLRSDNADVRLMDISNDNSLISKERYENIKIKKHKINFLINILNNTHNESGSYAKLLKRPESHWSEIRQLVNKGFGDNIWEEASIQIKNEGYIARQQKNIERSLDLEFKPISKNINYDDIRGLKEEAKIKLSKIKPLTLGQASRVKGVTPADISLLSIWISKSSR